MPSHPNPAVAHAFAYFRREVLLRIGTRPTESPSEPAYDLACTALHREAGLRLVWRERDNLLELAISHGPTTGGIAGWLDLYRATLTGSGLAPDHDVKFEDAVAYGLDLLRPAS